MTQRPSDNAADSGIRAVRNMAAHDDAGDPMGKLCLEISLLLNAYKLIEWGRPPRGYGRATSVR